MSTINAGWRTYLRLDGKGQDYSPKRWGALTRFLANKQLQIDNNWAENRVGPSRLVEKNCLFVGSLRAGQRAAAVMSLI